MQRKFTPAHNYWHPRVEGQIRDVMFHHPEWFNFESEVQKGHCINSLAKRIVGEIIAGVEAGANTGESAFDVFTPGEES